MKNPKYAALFCLVFLFATLFGLSAPAFAATTAWDGTADTSWYTENPTGKTFTVSTPAQLAGLAQIVNGTASGIIANNFAGDTVTLTADLNMGGVNLLGVWSGQNWVAIGAANNAFAGTFDGNNKHITNLYLNTTSYPQGLFGNTAKTAKIKNLSIDSGYLTTTLTAAGNGLGALVGNNAGAILNCSNNAAVNGGSNCSGVGGIAGGNTGYIIGSTNSGAVSAVGPYCAGISGGNSGTIRQCSNSGSVSSTYRGIGGIVASNIGTLTECYNTGAVSSTYTASSANVGGIVGSNGGYQTTLCYSTGTVTGTGTYVGGISGGAGTYANCFYLKTDTVNAALFGVGAGTAPAGEVSGVTAKTVDGLKSSDTLTALGSNFVTDSNNINHGYPVFTWQATGIQLPDEATGLDIAVNPTSVTAKSFTVTMNKLLAYTTLNATDFTVTATVNNNGTTDTYSFNPTAITQTNSGSATTVALTFNSVLAESTVQYAVQYNGGAVFTSDTITTPSSTYWSEYASHSFDGGTGTAADPYQIRTAAQLAYFGKTPDVYENSFFVLTADINLGGTLLWTPKAFNGCFDGQGHSISGLNINQSSGDTGFFSDLNVQSSATVRAISYVANLRFIAPAVKGYSTTGVIAGIARDTNLINCSVEGGTVTATGSTNALGGLVGFFSSSSVAGSTEISGCFSTATILAKGGYAGGLIGHIDHNSNTYGTVSIHDCWTGGSVTGGTPGGLVGAITRILGVEINHCFSTATVSGTATLAASGLYNGGLVGQGNLSAIGSVSMGAKGVTIKNCAALNPSVTTASTKSTALLGRIIANGDALVSASKGTFSNNYANELMSVKGSTVSADQTSNGTNLSKEMSYSQNFWSDTLGFDFGSVWAWSGDTNYPQLKGTVAANVWAIKFTLQPHDATAYRTKTATFGVTASGGTMACTYQWQYSTDNGATWKNIAAATAVTLNVGYQDGYASGTLFHCTVSENTGISATSDSAKLTVVTSKYMPADALKGIASYYKTKGTLDTAGEAFALAAAGKDLSGYKLNLPAHYTYLGSVNSPTNDGSSYLPWLMMDLYAQGEDPQNYVITSNGMNAGFNIIDFYLNTAQSSSTGGFEVNLLSPGIIHTNAYAIPSIITGLEMYFHGKDWGNEKDGTKLGRSGAIEYALSLLKDDASGGKTFSTLKTGSDEISRASQRAQCEFVLLMVRLSDDPVYGTQAKAAMSDVLKAMEAFYDDGKLTNTETGGYYVSALIGAASVTDNYFQKTGYLNLADEILKNIIAGSQSLDGGYSATIGTSSVTADAHATAAVMMALSDYNNESASLATFTYTVSDDDAVSNDLAALSLPTTVTGDLTLPSSGDYGSTITWATSDKNAVTAAGKVNRTSSDVTVTLTATVKKGDASQTKSFDVTVKADADVDTDSVDTALNAVTVPTETIGNVTVPTSSVKDVTFTWTTSDSNVLAIDGTVTRPAQGSSDVTVTLTLTATKGNVTKTREYPVLVYAVNTGYLEGYHTGRAYYLANRDIKGYWNVFAAYALLGDYIQDPANGYTVTLAQPNDAWYGSQYGATVLAICAMGDNPYDYNGVNWVQRLKDNYGGAYAGTIFSELAMEAAGADRSDYTASAAPGINWTTSKSMEAGVDIAGWASEILAAHAGESGVDDAVASFLQTLKTRGVESSGNFTGVNSISTACVVAGLSSLYAAGYKDADPTAAAWTNTTSNTNILDVLYTQFIVGKQYPDYLNQCYMALGDVVNAKNGGTSTWLACGVNKTKMAAEITKAEALLANENLYTGASVDTLETALTAAQAVSNDRLNAKPADYGEEYFTLLDAVKNIKTLGGADKDANAAATVTALINALPAADKITLDDKDSVTAARTAYDSLNTDQQGLVDSTVLAKLTAAEGAIKTLEDAAAAEKADEAAAKAVTDKINALPATVTLSDETAVVAARTAYNALTDTQKTKVSASVLAKLTAAESTVAALKDNKTGVKDMKDVASGAWYYDDVAYVIDQGIMKGTSATSFSPAGEITRAQFITVLGRYAGISDSGAANPSATKFNDVDSSGYYAAHVAWAIEKGITDGTSAKTFSPNAAISRQDMAVMLSRYAKAMNITLPAADSTKFVDDSKIAGYATDAVYQMKAAAILKGDSKNRFNPQDSAARAEAAAIMHRFTVYVDSVKEPEVETVTFDVEKFTLGQGYIVEPMLVEIEDNETVAEVFADALTQVNAEYVSSDTDMGFYLRRIKDNDTSAPNIPQYIVAAAGSDLNTGRARENWLGEFDYTYQGGWIYWVNNSQPDTSAGNYVVKDGDVIRWQFTVCGLGRDLGTAVGGGAPYVNTADKDALTTAIAKINAKNDATVKSSAAYTNAIAVLKNMESTQTEVDSALAALNK